MSSPDVSGAVDLTLFDVTPSELVDRGLVAAETQLPEATFPDGSIETVLLEPLSIMVAEISYGLNRLPGAVLEALLNRLYAIPRSAGLAPTATVEFTADASGASIPVGTLVQVVLDEEPIQFATDLELTIPAGTPTATVTVTGTEFTDAANGIIAGTPVEVTTATTGVTSAVLSTAIGGGAGAEDGETYLDRASLVLQRLNSTLVKAEHFEAYALEDPTVFRAKAVDNYDSSLPAVAAGHVSVAVLGPSGAVLSGPAKTALAAEMDQIAQVNLGVHVMDPTITAVNVTAQVHALPGADPTAVDTAVTAALDAYLSPLTWAWGATVRRNELIALMENVEGVDYVDPGHPTTPAADVALSGVAPLADAGTLNVTVV